MATILITHGLPAEDFCALEGHEIIIPGLYGAFSEPELMRLIPDADAVVAGGKLPGEIIRAGRKLKIIANYGAGFDGVDIKTAAECSIPVTNIPETVTHDTAELTVALMLAVSRRVGEMNLRLRGSNPRELFGMAKYMGRSLRGQTLGVIGCGRIGSRVAEIARTLGMYTIGYSRRGCDPTAAEPIALPELLERADIISLHCPLTDETRNLINRETIARMKPGVMLINTARGGIIDHAALTEALAAGHIAGAGIDVYPDEPNIPQALFDFDNVVLTPHIGANTVQTRRDMGAACSSQILDALSDRRPANIVNGI